MKKELDSEILQYLQNRLLNWADWYSRGNYYGLGFPSRSRAFEMIITGSNNQQPSQHDVHSNSEVEEIEELVVEMYQHNELMSTALRIFYFNQGSLRDKARKLKLTHTYFSRYVDLAHQWLAGRLSANIKPSGKNNCVQYDHT